MTMPFPFPDNSARSGELWSAGLLTGGSSRGSCLPGRSAQWPSGSRSPPTVAGAVPFRIRGCAGFPISSFRKPAADPRLCGHRAQGPCREQHQPDPARQQRAPHPQCAAADQTQRTFLLWAHGALEPRCGGWLLALEARTRCNKAVVAQANTLPLISQPILTEFGLAFLRSNRARPR